MRELWGRQLALQNANGKYVRSKTDLNGRSLDGIMADLNEIENRIQRLDHVAEHRWNWVQQRGAYEEDVPAIRSLSEKWVVP